MSGQERLDEVWRSLGTWGRFQVLHLIITSIDVFQESWVILSPVFTGYIPEYSCAETGQPEEGVANSSYYTNNYHQCDYDVYLHEGNTSSLVVSKRLCTEYSYAQENTYATEWNLVCSRANLAALAQSLVLAGQGIGALTMSHLADRFGRKTVHVLSHIGVLCTMLIMAFSQNITMLLVLRLVAGTFQQGMVCTGKILLLEMFPKEVRSHMEVSTFLAWSLGIMLLTMWGYIFRDVDWRYLQIGLAAFSVYALVEWWLLEESVRWLLSNGKTKEAERILRKAARWNNVDYAKVESALKDQVTLSPEHDKHDLADNGRCTPPIGNGNGVAKSNEDVATSSTDSEEVTSAGVKKYTIIDILKNPALRINTFILWYAWIVATGTYYGMTLVSSHLAGDRFVNFFLSGVIEAPSLLLEYYLFNKIGRKKTLILWYALAGGSLIVSTVLLTVLDVTKDINKLECNRVIWENVILKLAEEDTEITVCHSRGYFDCSTVLLAVPAHIHAFRIVATAFSLIGKSAATGVFSTVFLYTPEIYPTNYRNSGLGIASSISRIGGILAPFASNLALIALWIPGAIFGGMCLLVTVLALRLPESAQHELPKTIAECDKWENTSTESTTSSELGTISRQKNMPV